MFLTAEQVEVMTLDECELHLKNLTLRYNIDLPLIESIQGDRELWNHCDTIADTLLYLEDKIVHSKQVDNLKKANDIRWGKV